MSFLGRFMRQALGGRAGAGGLGQSANKAGVPVGGAGSLLAGLLPAAIDRLTPDGKLPDAGAIDDTLGSLLKLLGQ